MQLTLHIIKSNKYLLFIYFLPERRIGIHGVFCLKWQNNVTSLGFYRPQLWELGTICFSAPDRKMSWYGSVWLVRASSAQTMVSDLCLFSLTIGLKKPHSLSLGIMQNYHLFKAENFCSFWMQQEGDYVLVQDLLCLALVAEIQVSHFKPLSCIFATVSLVYVWCNRRKWTNITKLLINLLDPKDWHSGFKWLKVWIKTQGEKLCQLVVYKYLSIWPSRDILFCQIFYFYCLSFVTCFAPLNQKQFFFLNLQAGQSSNTVALCNANRIHAPCGGHHVHVWEW